METFEEYWSRSPGTGKLTDMPVALVKQIAAATFIAGQASATEWINEELKRRCL